MRLFGLFAKQPIPGAVKTRLAEAIGPVAAAELSEAFLRDLIGRFATIADRRWLGISPAAPSAVDWFRALAADRYELWSQPAGDLGARMEAFFTAAFSDGASRVVLIGGDSPTLPREFVDEAFDALGAHDVVLGPARDGGYYLIGVARQLFQLFAGVRWSTAYALDDTAANVRSAGLRLATLAEWYDVDTLDDLQFLQAHLGALRTLDPASPESATEAWLRRHFKPRTRYN
jgi:rSAM/selenodomain-associated transferase 1